MSFTKLSSNVASLENSSILVLEAVLFKEKRSTFGAIFLHFTPRWPYLHKTSIMNCAAILKTAHSTLYFIH